jgi:hypothetical protein
LENLECTRLLLAHNARIERTNALYRALDLENAAALELLLGHGVDANEPARNPPLTDWGSPLRAPLPVPAATGSPDTPGYDGKGCLTHYSSPPESAPNSRFTANYTTYVTKSSDLESICRVKNELSRGEKPRRG